MAGLGAEGWDSYGIDDVTDYFSSLDANSTIVAGAGRCSSSALRNTGAVGGGPSMGCSPSTTSGYAGWAFYPEAYHALAAFEVLPAAGGSTTQAFLRVLSNGAVDIWRGVNTTLGDQLAISVAGLVSLSHFTHLGMEWDISATGYARAYVNGVLVADSGIVDMRTAFSGGQWGLLHWRGIGYIDDLYWGDTSGPAPDNAFMGDQRVEEHLPLTDAVGGGGTYREFTCSAGSDHGALLDENPPNDDTDYVFSQTVGQRETVKFPNITPTSGAVNLVLYMPNLTKTFSSARSVGVLVRSGGSDALAASQALAQTTYRYFPGVYRVNPVSGSAWTPSTVNAAEAGVQVTV